MENVEHFLELEKEAEKLSEAIKSIYQEIGSYKNAKEDFLKTGEQLLVLIEKTDLLATNSHVVINKMNAIGMPQLLAKISELENQLINVKSEMNHTIDKHNIEIIKSNEGVTQQISESNKKNKMNSVLIAISIFATIINLTLLLIR